MSITTGVGLISGIDFESIITQMSAVTRRQVTQIQTRQATYQAKNQAYGTLVSQLSALRDQLQTMRVPADFLFREASSSNASALGVSAAKTAAVGTYQIDILQLAKAARTGSQGFAALDSTVASADGTFNVQVGDGEVRSYAVTATTTLAQLRDAINADSDSGVTTSIVNDGSSGTPYRLVLSAKTSGEANDIQIVQNDTNLTFTTIAEASDAIIEVDGIEIRRETNTFNDVIDGVTLTAKAVTTDPATVTVSDQRGLLNAEVIKFQTAYNNLASAIRQLTAYDSKSRTAQPLFADSAARMVKSGLASLITNPVPGLESEYRTLASLGMKLQADGTLGFNQATMNTVMDEDPDAIMRLFGRSGTSSNTAVQFVTSSDKTTAQSFQIDITTAAARATVQGAQALQPAGLAQDEALTFTYDDQTFVVQLTAGDTIDTVVSKLNSRFSTENADLRASNEGGVLKLQTLDYGSAASFSVVSERDGSSAEQLGIGTSQQNASGTDVVATINGASVVGEGQTVRGKTGTSSEGLELLVTATAPTTANVRVTSGVADRMLVAIEAYIDTDSGTLVARQEGLSKSFTDMNTRIDSIEARIEKDATRMRNQFLAMEKQLAQYQGITDMVTRSLSQLQAMMTR